MPKDVFVTEVRPEETKHLFLCRLCGEKYMEGLHDADVVTKSMEVVSTDKGISHSEFTVDGDNKPSEFEDEDFEFTLEDIARVMEEEEELPPPTEPPLIPEIKKVEAKLQEAVDKEDYESAGPLSEILKELQARLETESDGAE